MSKKIVIHEDDGKKEPDICGFAIELLNTQTSESMNMSLANIIINPGNESILHHHKKMEEIYYILDGFGEMIINDRTFKVRKGHAILIPIGARHQIINKSTEDLRFISVDSPPYNETDVYK